MSAVTASVSAAAARVESARSRLALVRNRALPEDVALAAARVLQARAARDEVAALLSYATIAAPIDGVIAQVATQEGETVSAGLNTPTVVTLIDLDRLEVATQRVIGGESLNRAARATSLLPETAARMVEVGEASGSLDTMLDEVAQFYEDILDTRLARAMALIEPLLMLLMGLIIGSIIIVMYLPIFRMAEVIA